MVNHEDYVSLGLTCVDICTALKQGMDGKGLGDLNQPVRKAVKRLRK